ncbi:PilN domain-containing protein [Desulfosoma caldarium]|uniref:Tfp pilus assembly protein PilN n=1 Tax=Desulfosoma caldarium TaxID=610254 RepID=A0A3N1VJZ5_9BACT|nr:PilN domain-containing protein [Desulfosoma caldarium]ROR03135.1 Tfp pilus assembly protein PilN [Desulfosoma caldarium]
MFGAKGILGIYVDEDRLDYVHAVKKAGRVRLHSLADGVPAHGALLSGGAKGLEAFLRELPLTPHRRVAIALPRSLFFVREVEVPPVPMEDALDVVRNALPIHVHLSVDDIYWSVDLVRRRNKAIAATLVYVEKKVVDPVLAVLADTGYRESLQGLFPISFGLAAWLRSASSGPVGLVRRDQAMRELLAVDADGVVCSQLVDPLEGVWDRDGIHAWFRAQGGVPPDRIYDWSDASQLEPAMPPKFSADWPHPMVNLGTAAAWALIFHHRGLCVDGRAPQLPGLHPAKVVVPFLLFLAVTAWGVGAHVERRTTVLERHAARLMEETQKLEAELKPLEKNAQEMEQLKKLIEEADVFIKGRPRFYELLNDVAERVPEGTWISRFSYSAGKITASFRSPDSLKTLEGLRASPWLKDVKLQGSVNRGRDGKEMFTVVLEVK